MRRKFRLSSLVLFLFALTLIPYSLVVGQETGIIRGTVYRDVNANGLCSNEGEARIANIPLELVNDEAQAIVRLSTAADGTFVLNQAALGAWKVTIAPGEGWRITAEQTREVVLVTDGPEVSNVDFCILEVSSSSGGSGGATLPESGAPIAPQLLAAAAIGFALMAAGAGLLLRDRLGRMK